LRNFAEPFSSEGIDAPFVKNICQPIPVVIESGNPTGHGFDHVFTRRGTVLKHEIQPCLIRNLAKANRTQHGRQRWRKSFSAGLQKQKSARSTQKISSVTHL
jgi:hypothetical protein